MPLLRIVGLMLSLGALTGLAFAQNAATATAVNDPMAGYRCWAQISWGTVADWIMVISTIVLAAVAVFQETIRAWFYKPQFRVSTKTEPPDCVAVPLIQTDGTFVADSIYLRIWIENVGNITAKNVEVYANDLLQQRLDGGWKRVGAFPPMNLKWSNLGLIYFPSIAPRMGKHCDIGRIADPAQRHRIPSDTSPGLALTNQQTSLAFDLMVVPNHKGHIIEPGKYKLKVLIAAENARPIKRTLLISLSGAWYEDERKMLRDGVGIVVIEE